MLCAAWYVIKRTESRCSAAETAATAEDIVKSKEAIVGKLKARGCRITRQRLVLIDIILEEECQSCKEIYFKAVRDNNKIGLATVYRMVNALEEIGAINRKLVLTL